MYVTHFCCRRNRTSNGEHKFVKSKISRNYIFSRHNVLNDLGNTSSIYIFLYFKALHITNKTLYFNGYYKRTTDNFYKIKFHNSDKKNKTFLRI